MFEVGKRHQLLLGDARLPAHGRADVDSEWASDPERGLDGGERFDLRIDTLGCLLGHFHLAGGEQQSGLVRGHFERQDDAAKFALGHPVEKTGDQSGFVGFESANARHKSILAPRPS